VSEAYAAETAIDPRGCLEELNRGSFNKKEPNLPSFFWLKQKVFAIWMGVFPHLKPSGTKTSLNNFIN